MPWEVNKADGSPDEPNDAQGDEECVRMRYGLMNDAQCTKQVSGSMRENLGMGYVCERHANLIPTEAPQITTDSNIYSTCEENEWGIEPFKVWNKKRVRKKKGQSKSHNLILANTRTYKTGILNTEHHKYNKNHKQMFCQ